MTLVVLMDVFVSLLVFLQFPLQFMPVFDDNARIILAVGMERGNLDPGDEVYRERALMISLSSPTMLW